MTLQVILQLFNTFILLILGALFFSQDKILKYMKTAMETINPEKIKAAQQIIDEGKEYEMKLKLSGHIHEITQNVGKRFQDVNKDFLEQYNELINIPFSIMYDKDWQFRERHLLFYPKNAPALRAMLEAYDKGELFPTPDANKNAV